MVELFCRNMAEESNEEEDSREWEDIESNKGFSHDQLSPTPRSEWTVCLSSNTVHLLFLGRVSIEFPSPKTQSNSNHSSPEVKNNQRPRPRARPVLNDADQLGSEHEVDENTVIRDGKPPARICNVDYITGDLPCTEKKILRTSFPGSQQADIFSTPIPSLKLTAAPSTPTTPLSKRHSIGFDNSKKPSPFASSSKVNTQVQVTHASQSKKRKLEGESKASLPFFFCSYKADMHIL